MVLFRREHKASPLVTAVSGSPETRIDDVRLGVLGMCWLALECECGHTGKVAVPDLAGRYGCEMCVHDAVAELRCTQCGQARILNISISD